MRDAIIEDNNYLIKPSKLINYYKCKWINLKYLLQVKVSYESSVKLLKLKTIEQFTSKCCEIYKEKIQIHLLSDINKQIISSNTKMNTQKKGEANTLPNIKIKKDLKDLCNNSSIHDFLFYLRKNNDFMLQIIKNVSREKRKILIPFLCHFFYENFFNDSQEQEEILYIIYLLLEEDIDRLESPSILSFLEDSFLGDFLIEIGNKYENKKYIDLILNSIIRDVEDKSSSFISLDILSNSNNHYKNYKYDNDIKISFFDMKKQDYNINSTSSINEKKELNRNMSLLNNPSINDDFTRKRNITTIGKISKVQNIKHKQTDINPINYEKSEIKNLINENFFEDININYLKKLLEKEEDEVMKTFYINQIKLINLSKKPNMFNYKDYYEEMKKRKIISKLSIEQFNQSVEIITNFIDKLLLNLENKIIIPYNIKVICKFIYILMKNKFRNISSMQCNSFISRFLFDKLIFPVLENPDVNNSAKNMIISLNTRKILASICKVLRNLVRGELFNSLKNENFTVFNKYIIQNYSKINNIIKNFINVHIPDKLLTLSMDFYYDDDFSLEDMRKYNSNINYNYFDENPNDFMQHKSICFNISQFILLYGLAHINEKYFAKIDDQFSNILKNIKSCIGTMKCNKYDYYVIIDEEYNTEIKQLLSLKEKNIILNNLKNEKDALFKLKFGIRYLLSNLQITNNCDWINNNYNTNEFFNFINKYLKVYGHKYSPPLNWYSQFIVKNLNSIDNIYKKNDYELLYNEIQIDNNISIKKLKKLNEFLTVNMTTKFFIIENIKKRFKEELENVKQTKLNIEILLFIESYKIKICLMKGEEYNYFLDINEKPIGNNSLVICYQDNCPHSNMTNIKNIYKKKYHCNNVKEFANKFASLHDFICDEIINYSLGEDFNNSVNSKVSLYNLINKDNKDRIINQNIFVSYSSKVILQNYMDFIKNEINNNNILNLYEKNDFEIIPLKQKKLDELISKKEKENKEKVINIIWNYILKYLRNKMDETKSVIDKSFNLKCFTLNGFIKPKHLNIPQEIINENILNIIKSHIERIDELRMPGNIIEEFGKVFHLNNLLFKFFLNNEKPDAGDLVPLNIYCIIIAKPKRIIFNVNFIKYFLNENELLGGFGYNIIQAESSINFIKNLQANQIGITQEEFNSLSSSIIL